MLPRFRPDSQTDRGERQTISLARARPKRVLYYVWQASMKEIKKEEHHRCPRCGEGRLRAWRELDDEERLVVGRLPASADYTPDERTATHLWCKRCWYEQTGGASNANLT